MNLPEDKLIELLIKQNYVSATDIENAKKSSGEAGVINYLISQKALSEDLLGQSIAEFYKIPYFDLNSNPPTKEMVLKLPGELAIKNRVVLIGETDKEASFTTDSPESLANITPALQTLFPNKKLNFVFSITGDIDDTFTNYKQSLDTEIKKIVELNDKAAPEIFNYIIQYSLESRASDIHFEPLQNEVAVRFRIDGNLQLVGSLTRENYENLLNRVKVLARLRIDEHFASQDGSVRLTIGSKNVDLRVSIVPIVDGEKIVIRLLSDYVRKLELEDLGLSERNQELVSEAYKKSYGMILSTGPTGSGKTTTLYSILRILHKPEVNITTIEDPVEYKIQGINQIQVNDLTGLTFAKGLRSIVRQDPNVILVGEIRDEETAEIAVNAALTGHLLLSSFHANDAATAIPRLLDMGIEPFLLASTLNLIVAQRLLRRLCDSCRYSENLTTKDFANKYPGASSYFSDKTITLYKAKGCNKCNNTGYKGRIGIFEILYVTPAIHELILNASSSQKIWEIALNEGAVSFFADGIEKVKAGITSMEELLRVAPIKIEPEKVNEKTKGRKK